MITSLPTFDVRRMIVFLKSTRMPSPSSIHLVEDLEEELVHVGVGLLDFVEQHDAVRARDGRLR